MIDERIAERRATVRDDRRRRRLRRTRLVGILLVLIAVLVAVERSALVALEEVEVTGTQRLDPDEVRAASGLEPGTSTLRLRLGDAVDRVAALPQVRHVEGRRLDPLTVRLEVEERIPALLVSGGGQRGYLDRDGVMIDLLDDDEDPLAGLPEVALSGEPPEPGAPLTDAPALANAYRTWRGLSGSLRAEVVRYEAAGPDELTLELARGVSVRFGRAERLDEKVRALGAVLDDVGDTEVAGIDVRAPSAPVITSP